MYREQSLIASWDAVAAAAILPPRLVVVVDTAVVVTPRLLLLLLLLLVPIQLVMVLRFGFFFQVLLLDCDQPYRHHQSFWIVVGPSPSPPPRATIRTRWLALQLHSSAVQFGICLLVVIFSSRLVFFLFTLLTFNFFLLLLYSFARFIILHSLWHILTAAWTATTTTTTTKNTLQLRDTTINYLG